MPSLGHLTRRFRELARDAQTQPSHGQGLAEYALILGLVAIVSIIALIFMGGAINGALSTIGSTL
jgi:Flp pilus assembly pilin Flp